MPRTTDADATSTTTSPRLRKVPRTLTPSAAARPSGAGVRPVALETAVLSIAGLEPSRKELNILGFSPPRLACSSLRPQYFHTVSGVDWAKCGSHLWPRPAAVTEKPEARAQSTSSQISAGWSP